MGPESTIQRLYDEFVEDETPDEEQVNFVFHTYHGLFFYVFQREHRFRLSPARARELLWRLHLFNVTWGLLAPLSPLIALLSLCNYRVQRLSIENQERANAEDLAERRRPDERRSRRRPAETMPRPLHRSPSVVRMLVGFFGAGLMAVSVLAGSIAVYVYLDMRASADWPLVTAEMMDFQAKRFGDEPPSHYHLWAKYRYTVNGTRFVGYQRTRDPVEADDAELDRLKTLYVTGNPVEAHVSPNQPSRSALWPESSASDAYWVAIAVAVLIVGFGLTVFGFRPRKARPAALDHEVGEVGDDPGASADSGNHVDVPEHEAHSGATDSRRVVRQERVLRSGKITRTYRHLACDGETLVSGKLLRALSAPTMGPSETDCAICGKREAIEQFVWTHTDETVFQARSRIQRSLPLPLRVVTSTPTAIVVFAGGIAVGVVMGINDWWWTGLRVGIAATAVLVGLNIGAMRLLAMIYGIKFERIL